MRNEACAGLVILLTVISLLGAAYAAVELNYVAMIFAVKASVAWECVRRLLWRRVE